MIRLNAILTAVRRRNDGCEIRSEELEEWKTTSSIACWYCSYPFTTVPVFLPVSRPIKTERHAYKLVGNFCSFNCAKAYALLNVHDRDCLHHLSILAFLVWHRPKYCCRRPGRPHPCDCVCLSLPHGIRLPPNYTELQRYGGTKTISQFRKDLMVIEKSDWISMYLNNFKGIYVPYEQIKPQTKMIEIKSPLVHVQEKKRGNISHFIKTQS